MNQKNLKPTFIFVLFLTRVAVAVIMDKPPGLYIDMKNIYSGSGIAPGYSSTFTWLQPLPNIITSCLSLYNFQLMHSTTVISYVAELSFPNSTSGTITFSSEGSDTDISYVGFCVLVVTESYPNFELLVSQQNIAGFDWDGSFYSAPPFYLTSSTFTFNSTINSYIILQWVKMSSPVVSIELLNYQRQLIVGTNLMMITFTSGSDSTIYQIKLGVFLLRTTPLYNNTNYFEFFADLGTFYPSSLLPAQINVPTAVFGRPKNQMRCFFGLETIILVIGSGPITFRLTYTGSGANAISGATDYTSFAWIKFYVLCMGRCSEGTYLQAPYSCVSCTIPNCLSCTSPTACTLCSDTFALSSAGNSCLQCKSVIPGCYDCEGMACTQCFPEFALTSASSCSLCRNFLSDCFQCSNQSVCTLCFRGEAVVGGCTKVLGCVEVQSISGLNICVRCDESEYQSLPVNGECVCSGGGEIVGGHCTSAFGCVSTQAIDSIVECSACDVAMNFQLDGGNSCSCIRGYYLDTEVCLPICGDGLVLSSEDCDDSNADSGDGCSPTCELQANFRCSSSPSFCQYIGEPLTITLVRTVKTAEQNQGVFTFEVRPEMPLLLKYDYSPLFSFECDATYQISSWTYTHGQLTLVVDYQTDLETEEAAVSFAFDQLYIKHQPVLLNFTIKSDGVMLIIEQHSIKLTALTYLLLTVTGVSLFLLVFGFALHPMVGIQAVNCLQVIYYLHYTIDQYTPVISFIQKMSLIGLNDLFLGGDKQNFRETDAFQKVQFSMGQTQVTLLGLSCFLLLLQIVMLLFVTLPKLGFKVSECQQKALLFCQKLLFSSSVLFLIPFFLILFTFSQRHADSLTLYSHQTKSLLLTATMASLSLVFCSGIKHLFISSARPHQQGDLYSIKQESYTSTYLLYLILQMLFLILLLRTGSPVPSYFLLSLQFLAIFWVIKVGPYERALQNLSLILNFSSIIMFQIFVELRNKGIIAATELSDIFCLLIILGVIMLGVLLSTLRFGIAVVFELKSLVKRMPDVQREFTVKKMLSQELQEQALILSQPHRKMIQSNSHFLNFLNKSANQDNLLVKEEDESLVRMREKQKAKFYQHRNAKKRVPQSLDLNQNI